MPGTNTAVYNVKIQTGKIPTHFKRLGCTVHVCDKALRDFFVSTFFLFLFFFAGKGIFVNNHIP